jgi:glycine dehydrogenase subunit 1
MPFIPHTDDDVQEMLAAIGAGSLDDLFDEIPKELLIEDLDGVPPALSEMEITRLMRARAAQDRGALCFVGAGAYEHHIPTAVWDIATRGEFYSAYTPYQAEASQGTLQTIYEYQTMITSLTGLDVSNASLYDGASSLAEAALMAIRANRKSKSNRVLLAAGVSPIYRKVAQAIAGSQGLTFDSLPIDTSTGTTDLQKLKDSGEPPVAVVIQQPSFFGTLEQVDQLCDWAHEHGALVIAIINPTSLAILKAPGTWGAQGADIACGEGQSLGVPLSSQRQTRIHIDVAGTRATHSALESDVKYLYKSGAYGDRCDHLHGLARPSRIAARRARLRQANGEARGITHRNQWRREGIFHTAF